MKLAWGAKVSADFRAKVLSVCAALGWDVHYASWLMACMHFESGGTFSPSIRNGAGSGATGLIQFMPKTAIGLGTTVGDLAEMSAVEQLDVVARYFKPYASKIKSLADMYMAILLPSAIGKPDDAVLFSSGAAYRQNAALDADSDGKITKAEAAARVMDRLVKGLQLDNAFDMTAAPGAATPKETDMPPFLLAALPALIQALPDFAAIFKNKDVAERNVAAVAKAADIIVSAVPGATNLQDAVEKVTTDPVAAAAANSAIRMSKADLMDIVERMNDMEQKNLAAAREYNTAEPIFVDTPWVKMKFIHLLSLVFVGFSGTFVTINWSGLTPELKGAVITLMIIAGWNGVRDYWMGSSDGSKTKDLFNRQ